MTATRAISGLRFAALCGVPNHAGRNATRGKKAHGVRYEKLLAKGLGVARHGQWFQFIDSNGHGYCQTDLLIEFRECVAVLEAKYTWTPQGHFQVERLYKPVLERAFGKPVRGFVVCKKLTDGMGETLVVSRLMEALSWSENKRVAMHWMGGEQFLRIDPGTRLGAPIPAYLSLLAQNIKSA